MNNILSHLQEWLLRNNKNQTYGDLLKISRGEQSISDSFYTADEKDELNTIHNSNKQRLMKFG